MNNELSGKDVSSDGELSAEQLDSVLGGVPIDKGIDSIMKSNILPDEKKAKLEKLKAEFDVMRENSDNKKEEDSVSHGK